MREPPQPIGRPKSLKKAGKLLSVFVRGPPLQRLWRGGPTSSLVDPALF